MTSHTSYPFGVIVATLLTHNLGQHSTGFWMAGKLCIFQRVIPAILRTMLPFWVPHFPYLEPLLLVPVFFRCHRVPVQSRSTYNKYRLCVSNHGFFDATFHTVLRFRSFDVFSRPHDPGQRTKIFAWKTNLRFSHKVNLTCVKGTIQWHVRSLTIGSKMCLHEIGTKTKESHRYGRSSGLMVWEIHNFDWHSKSLDSWPQICCTGLNFIGFLQL